MYTPKYIKGKNFLSFREFHFDFRNKEAILIQGRNLEDRSQKGNGSGKSSLVEAISFAATGSSMRDIVTKELIFKGQKEGEVEWYLENKVLNRTLKIWRKVYANTKSAEWKIWINDVEKTDIPDFNEFNRIVFQELGISKEDFFNFYLITEEMEWIPFLKASDTKKKDIINRFSGANKVDNVFPLVEADSGKKQKEIDQINQQITSIQGKTQLLTEQIVSEEEKNSDEAKATLVEKLDNELTTSLESITKVNTQLDSLKRDLNVVEVEIDVWKFSKDYDSLIKSANTEKIKADKTHEELKKQVSDCKSLFSEETNQIIADEAALKEEKQSIRESINEYQVFIDNLNNHIQSSIECPSCGHKFTLKDKSFNVQEALELLPESQKELEALQKELDGFIDKENAIQDRKNAVNQKVIDAQSKIKDDLLAAIQLSSAKTKEIGQLEEDKKKEENSLIKLKNDRDIINQSIRIEEGKINQIKQRQEEIKTEKKKVLEVDTTRIAELEQQTVKFIEEEEGLNEKLSALVKEKEEIDIWLFNFKSFKSFLANKSIRNIKDYTNMYLEMMGSNITIDMDGYRLMSNKKIKEEITTTVNKDGFEVGSYGTFSRGERGRINLSNVLGMQELVNINSPTGGIDMLIADEVLDAVDALGIESMIKSCQQLEKTVVIISQNEINNLPKHTVIIEKKNKESKIIC